MTRKIIQIAIGEKQRLVALADDGTLWYRSTHNSLDCGFAVHWYKVQNIPQD